MKVYECKSDNLTYKLTKWLEEKEDSINIIDIKYSLTNNNRSIEYSGALVLYEERF